jgi:hypothetical protein
MLRPVTTPPRPTRADFDAALLRIHGRRRAAGDDHPLALSEDPREVLAYLRQRGRTGLVQDDTGDDVVDALTLRLWLWWEGESIELWLLEAAEALGRNRKTVGGLLGIASGQGVVDRIVRKRAMLGRDQAVAAPPAASARDAEIRALAAELVGRRGEMPEEIADGFEVDTLADALPRWPAGAAPPSEGVLNAVRFLLGDLVVAVPADAPLRAVVDAGAALVGTRHVPT